MTRSKTAIYDPPKPGFPYLVVRITGRDVSAVPVKTREHGQAMIEARSKLQAHYGKHKKA